MTVTNITDANITITKQVDKFVNHLATKDSDMADLTRMNIQLQWKIKTLRENYPNKTEKKTEDPEERRQGPSKLVECPILLDA